MSQRTEKAMAEVLTFRFTVLQVERLCLALTEAALSTKDCVMAARYREIAGSIQIQSRKQTQPLQARSETESMSGHQPPRQSAWDAS